eukprot:610187-Pelagomonas_calceolata.AAC.1
MHPQLKCAQLERASKNLGAGEVCRGAACQSTVSDAVKCQAGRQANCWSAHMRFLRACTSAGARACVLRVPELSTWDLIMNSARIILAGVLCICALHAHELL